MDTKQLWKFTALFLIFGILIASCSPAAQSANMGNAAPAATSEPTKKPLRVGLLVDNTFGDRAFFDIGLDGLKLLEKNYGAVTHKYEGKLQPDNFVPLLTDAANSNDLVFVLGFNAIDALLKVAKDKPNTQFVFIDSTVDSPDVASLVYRDQEGCYTAGALAALMTSRTDIKNINKDKVIGFVGGVDAPVIRRCEAGYIQGAAAADPEVKVETIMVGSFVDPAKGKEANLALIQKGSDINYQYAGSSGNGGFDAAKGGAPMYAIGAGFDQRWMAQDQTIGSMLKRVDLSMDFITKEFVSGNLKKGAQYSWGIKEDGVPFTFSTDLVPADIVTKVSAMQDDVKSGKVVVKDN